MAGPDEFGRMDARERHGKLDAQGHPAGGRRAMGTPGQRHAEARDSRVRSAGWWALVGLGALWLVDGILQLQPAQFSAANLAVGTVGGALMALPPPLYAFSLRVVISDLAPYDGFWTVFVAGLEIAIAAGLLVGPPRAKRAALVASAAFGGFLWVFAEGMGGILEGTMHGGIFPGTPSLFNGFPGAGLVYSLVSLMLLIPQERWNLSRRFSAVRMAPALLLLVCVFVQAAPLMWTSFGQASIFTAASDNLTPQMAPVAAPLERFAVAFPMVTNALELAATLVAAVGLGLGRAWGYRFALALLAFVWVFGVGLGGVLTGAATDPNTPPAIALLMIPAIAATRSAP